MHHTNDLTLYYPDISRSPSLYKTKRAPNAPTANPTNPAPASWAPAPVYGVTGLEAEGVAVAAQEVPNEVGAAGAADGAVGAAVVSAAALLGPPAARAVMVLVWPAETMVEVVKRTWGTVTVVVRVPEE